MSRPVKWILAIMGIILSAFSLYTIYISGKPVFDSSNIIGWIGFAMGLLILMVLLYYLSIKIGILYTIILLLLFLIAMICEKSSQEEKKELSSHQNQFDEYGEIVIEHPYDHLISLEWGTLNQVDLDLMLIEKKDNFIVNFSIPQYILDDNNSIWLDYDYQMQKEIPSKEVISILGMKDKTFSVIVINYNGETLQQDAVVTITLSDENSVSYTLPAQQLNDDTNSIYVCDIVLSTEEITEVMKDFHNER